MAPQARGEIPKAQLDELHAARTTLADADERFRTAVADALKAGGSVREVAAACGLSTNTVQRWGREGGWPTDEQRQTRAAAREANADWLRRISLDPDA